MRKNLGGFGTLLMLGLGLGLLHNNPAPSATPPTIKLGTARQLSSLEEATTPASTATICGKPTCAEQDLFDAVANSSANEALADKPSLDEEFKSLANGENKFAMAIVPDPKHTHLSLFTDRTIDAIQQGAQQAGWIFDRATLPWDSEEHPESTDFHIRLQQKKYQDDAEEWPGLMIFRPDTPSGQKLDASLFLFVVGETPTGGINKRQFRHAETLIKLAAGTEPLRIIGPTFSGSLYSLAQLLSQQPADGKFSEVMIRSGTVSSSNTIQWFQNFLGQLRSNNGISADFATFLQSDLYMLRKFVEFEKARGYQPEKIALLAEDETAYGNQDSSGSAPPKNQSTDGNEGKKPACPDKDAIATADEKLMLHLYFPRDISQLRSAYQQGLQQKLASSSDPYQIRSTLPLNLQDTGSDDDSAPQYAHSETPLSQESILLGIIASIRERHIQFVVLQATNPADTLFLSAFLKKGYSQARVVAMGADLLLSRDADDVSLLHGVMALTTYSLLPGLSQEVAIPKSLPGDTNAEHVFPAAVSAGIYNAALSQIKCFQSLSAVGCKIGEPAVLPVAHYAEYGWPVLAGNRPSEIYPLAPVVWLTVLGRGGFWPLAILDDVNYSSGDASSSVRPIGLAETSAPQDFTPPWPVLWGIVCGLVVALIALYCLLLRESSILSSSSALTLLARVHDPCRSALIAIIGWMLLVALLLLVWPWAAWWKLGVLPIVCLLVALAATLALCYVCISELKRRATRHDHVIFGWVAAALVVCFVILYVAPGHAHNPFLYRYIHLSSGVSPLLPFLCLLAAGLWWAWFSLSSLALLDKRRPQLPSDSDLPAIPTPGHTTAAVTNPQWPAESLASKLVGLALPCTRPRRVYLAAFFVFIVALFSLDYGHPLLSLETRHFEWIYAGMLAAVTLSLFGAIFRLLAIWLECRRILVLLDHFPIRRAFAALNFTWEPFWRLGGGRLQDLYRLVSRELETLEHLKQEIEAGECSEEVRELVKAINQTAQAQDNIRGKLAPNRVQASQPQIAIESVNASEAKTPAPQTDDDSSDRLMSLYSDLQKHIGKTCAAALKYLQPKWWSEEGLIICEVSSGEDAKKDEDNPELPLATRLAERFVALVYLNFILSILLRMKALEMIAIGIYVFLVLSVNSYPFEPMIALRSGAILLLIFIVGVVGYVSSHVHRDSILSLVTQTKPGELGVAFWLRMGTFVALPLLSLLVSQFPSLNNVVFSWLEPAANALK